MTVTKLEAARAVSRFEQALAVQRARQQESIHLFEPTDIQQPIVDCTARTITISGGNRCLGKDEMIYDPVAGLSRKVSEITEPFHVESLDRDTGKVIVCRAGVPFLKAHDELYRYEVGGKEFVATKAHRAADSAGYFSPLRHFVNELGGTVLNSQLGLSSIRQVEFTGTGEVWDFEVEGTHNYVHQGIFHHNSSKTTIAAYLWASWLLQKRKNPSLPAEGGRLYCVGANETHLGEVMYRKLFRPGMFKVIVDKKTGLLRAFHPWDPEDMARVREARPAAALIPERFVKDRSWRLKKDNIPRMVTLHNGWEILFLTGEGVPAQGFDANGVWFDEEIGNPDWFMEAMRGLIDRSGVFVWSATPQAATEQFLRLMERAEDDETGRLAKFVLPTTTNPHLNKAEVEEYAANLSEEQQQVRIQGEPAVQSFLMFPTFDMEVLGFDRERLPERQVPEDWTRYMYVDPGYGVTYCLFVAVPPPKHPFGDIWLCYDELYLPKCTSDLFGERVANKIGSQYFQAYIIDMKHGQKTETSGKTNMQQLSEALRARRCSCVETGYGFIKGYTDRLSGWSLLRDSMRSRPGTGTKLRVLRGACPNLERCMKRLRRHRKRSGTGWVYEDDVAPGQDDHPVDAARYLASHEPIWVYPEPKPPVKSWAVLRYEEKMRKQNPQKVGVVLGPARFSEN